MSRLLLRQKAIDLRKLGKTYSEIRTELNPIPKSTLSEWLKNYPLTKSQLDLLEKHRKTNKFLSIEKTRITKKEKYESRLLNTYQLEKKLLIPQIDSHLAIAGLFLYWGEGSKSLRGALSLNNTDPNVLKFTLYWLTKGLNVSKEKIKVYLHLYSDMDIPEEMNYWSTQLNIPLSQFSKPYIKKSERINLSHKGFGHGTCGLMVCDTLLREKITMGIKSIADYYAEKIKSL